MQHTDEIEHLDGKEAIEKMQALVNDANICMFTTLLTELPLDARPMATQKVDNGGNLWFLSGASSHKNQHIQRDARVQLFYSHKTGAEFLSVYGEATIYKDRQKIEEIWNNIAKAWFKGGKDDPDLTVIKVKPQYAYYWDTKSNKVISLIKIATSAITGATMDEGVQGELNVRR